MLMTRLLKTYWRVLLKFALRGLSRKLSGVFAARSGKVLKFLG